MYYSYFYYYWHIVLQAFIPDSVVIQTKFSQKQETDGHKNEKN